MNMKLKSLQLPGIFFLLLALSFSACKKDDDDPTGNNGDGDKVLVIENGAQSIRADEGLSYTARFVHEDGSTSAATGVTWSSSASGVASISAGGVINAAGIGTTTITAKVSEGDQSWSVSVPLGIVATSVFAVAPSAIVWETSGGPIQLETVYFGTSSPSYTYSSSDGSVASVNGSGLVTFNGPGECVISVTSSIAPSSPFLVPVLVVGTPTLPLPVTRVEVDPASADIFRGESINLTATAYNASGTVQEAFAWSSSAPDIATVDDNGTVTGHAIGSVYIRATAKGITGQAEIIVNPDTVILVEPFIASIPAGGTKQMSATAYNARNGMTVLNGVTNFNWEIPTYGFSVFDFASVNSSGLVSVNNNALPGNLTFVVASIPGSAESAGAAVVMVSTCDCGNGNPDVSAINAGGPVSLSLFSTPSATITATATDSNGNTVANPALKFCSDNTAVCTVDEDTGEVFATGVGTATVTVCSGGFAETTVQVNVNL